MRPRVLSAVFAAAAFVIVPASALAQQVGNDPNDRIQNRVFSVSVGFRVW